jgi:hypothetical protein
MALSSNAYIPHIFNQMQRRIFGITRDPLPYIPLGKLHSTMHKEYFREMRFS